MAGLLRFSLCSDNQKFLLMMKSIGVIFQLMKQF